MGELVVSPPAKMVMRQLSLLSVYRVSMGGLNEHCRATACKFIGWSEVMTTQDAARTLDQSGSLDPGFGDNQNGTILLQGTKVEAIAVLKAEGANQGKIIGAISNGSSAFTLFRLDKTGLLDRSFGPDGTGYATGRFGADTTLPTVRALTIIDNGSILVTGDVRQSSLGPHYPAAALFNSNGTPNLVFGTFRFEEAPPTLPVESSVPIPLNDAEAKAGKILFAVNNSSPGPYRNWGLLIQLTLNGELDKDLDGRGYVYFRHNNENTTTVGAVTQTDGTIVLAGYTSSHAFLAGFTSNGKIDPTFGTGGIKTFESPEGAIRLSKVLAQPDNKLIAVGTVTKSPQRGWVTRTLSNGTSDNTFNNGNEFITQFPFRSLQWNSADIDSKGSIVVAGEIDQRLCIVGRITEDGRVDTTFTPTGLSDPNAADTPNVTTSVAVQSDARIIVAGIKTDASVSGYVG